MLPSATLFTVPVIMIEKSSPISIPICPPGMWTVTWRSTSPSRWASPGLQDRGFLVLDNDYEARGSIRSAPPSQYNRTLHTEVRIGFAGPSTVYAVSMLVNEREVSFSRVEVECL